MDQSLQHQYLQTLGLVQYVPRDTVYENTDAASLGAGIPVPAVEESETVAKSVKQPIDIAALVNLDLDSKPASPAKAIAKPSVLESVMEKAQPALAIELVFSLWQASEELLVCSAVESALADTDEMQLLTNILNAVGCGISRLPQMALVEWPPYPNAPGDEAEVREFLSTLLHGRLVKKPVKAILLLGDSAANWLLPHETLNQQKDGGRVVLSQQTTALLLPSLSSMIENPEHKAIAWQELQFLIPAAVSS